MPTPKAQDKSITINGLRLHYLDWGTQGNPPMVCLHGHTGHAHIWDEFSQAMSARYHVYALDQRGHGDSQWAKGSYQREQFVDDLAAFLDALALGKVTLVGLSMGGWNCLLYTPAHQERVERVVLVDIGPESSDESRQQMANRPPTPLAFEDLETAFKWVRQNNIWATDDRLRKDVGDRLKQRPDGRWTWKADPTLYTVPLKDMDDPESVARYWRSLGAIRCPILEVRGKDSPLLSDEILGRMGKATPLFSAVDVEGAGHNVPVDKPQEFIAVTRDFLGVPS